MVSSKRSHGCATFFPFSNNEFNGILWYLFFNQTLIDTFPEPCPKLALIASWCSCCLLRKQILMFPGTDVFILRSHDTHRWTPCKKLCDFFWQVPQLIEAFFSNDWDFFTHCNIMGSTLQNMEMFKESDTSLVQAILVSAYWITLKESLFIKGSIF